MESGKRVLSIVLISVFLFLYAGCSSEKKYFYGLPDEEGMPEKILLKKEKGVSGTSFSYTLSKPYSPGGSEGLLFLKAEFQLPEGQYLFGTISDSGTKYINFFSDSNSKAMLFFTLSGSSLLKGFSIERSSAEGSSPDEENRDIQLESVRIIDRNVYFEGYSRSEGILMQSENFSQLLEGDSFHFRFTPLSANQEITEKRLTIGFEMEPGHTYIDGIEIALSAGDRNRRIMAYPVKGIINITMADISGIFPGIGKDLAESFNIEYTVSIRTGKEKNSFKTISIYEGSMGLSTLSAVEADLATILDYDMDRWRHKRFEIFSWSVVPEFLVIDTLDYAFQSAMFKRLAFFVEKPGTAGKLLTDGELQGKHGWNAHDYRAEDLCDFFNLAEKTGFLLSAEEELLKLILLENKIVRKLESSFYPVGGGILSLSRESTPRLRRVFILHEGYHGVFFASEEFRKRCLKIWEESSSEIRRFWEFFLAHKGYDTKNQYLLVNEFMAYNLQQIPEAGDSYFFDYIIPALYHNYPSRREFLDNLRENYRGEFLEISKRFAETLFEVTGLPAGDLFFIDKLD